MHSCTLTDVINGEGHLDVDMKPTSVLTVQPVIAPEPGLTLSPSLRAAAQLLMLSLIGLGLVFTLGVDQYGGIILVFVGLFGQRGLHRGVIVGCCGVCAMLAAYYWAVPLGHELSHPLIKGLRAPLVPGRYFAILLTAVVILALGEFLGSWLARRHRQQQEITSRAKHIFSMLLACVQGAIFGIMICSVWVALQPAALLTVRMGRAPAPWVAEVVSQIDQWQQHATETRVGLWLLESFEPQHRVLEMGAVLATISQYPGSLSYLQNDPVVVGLLEKDPLLQRIQSDINHDAELRRALKQGDRLALLNSPVVLQLLEDRHLAEVIERHGPTLYKSIIAAIPPEFLESAIQEISALPTQHLQWMINDLQARLAEQKNIPPIKNPAIPEE
ncbi:MAG: hypothetical protein HJJLKODD_00292 [Phycisphaerae bacterium]|nr:hypothetical protein [Phycisphaerae bacterium]